MSYQCDTVLEGYCTSHCCRCAWENCVACEKGFVLTNGRCYYVPKCSEHCDSCTSSTDCRKCSDGYILHQGYCLSSCPAGFFKVGSSCQSCNSNCRTCSSSSICSRCNAPYKLFSGKCFKTCPIGTIQSGDECIIISNYRFRNAKMYIYNIIVTDFSIFME